MPRAPRRKPVKKRRKTATKKAKKKTSAKETAAGARAKRFQAPLERVSLRSQAVYITVPFDVEQAFGTRARVPVRGTINGYRYRTSLSRMREGHGPGAYIMPVSREMREGAGLHAGDTVKIVMQRDDEPRVVTLPDDFARALKGNPEAQAVWDRLSHTHQTEHVRAIEEAAKLQTRRRRIEKAVETLAHGVKPG
jgi:hypothetical protein